MAQEPARARRTHGAGQPLGFRTDYLVAELGHAIVAAPFVIERRVWALFGFLHQTGSQHAFQAAVEGARPQLQGAIGLLGHILHDAVSMPLFTGQRDQNVEDRGGERKHALRIGRFAHTSVTDIVERIAASVKRDRIYEMIA